jgi:hypothetical protein
VQYGLESHWRSLGDDALAEAAEEEEGEGEEERRYEEKHPR